jgi:hypothetical protein
LVIGVVGFLPGVLRVRLLVERADSVFEFEWARRRGKIPRWEDPIYEFFDSYHRVVEV